MEGSSVYRSGFVAVIGRTSVGKSTLLNALLGQKIAAVSQWPQTTRRRQLGILTLPDAQVILMDTPGLHEPRNALGRAMLRTAEETVNQADIILYLADLSRLPDAEDREFAAWILKTGKGKSMLLSLNKSDLVPAEDREEHARAYQALLPQAEVAFLSAQNGEGLPELLRRLAGMLPAGPALYPPEEITDLTEREIAADIVREAAIQHLRAEVPHGVAVRIDDYAERGAEGAFIEATILVERESHKAIVIGKGGMMLKVIGTEARRKIEEMNGRKVFLQLRVKVLPGWRNSADQLRRLGYGSPDH